MWLSMFPLILLQFKDFDTELNDVVDLWAGGRTLEDSVHVATLSGNYSNLDDRPIIVLGENNYLSVVLHANKNSPGTAKGFRGDWRYSE